jgi:hypothetical protein
MNADLSSEERKCLRSFEIDLAVCRQRIALLESEVAEGRQREESLKNIQAKMVAAFELDSQSE